MSASAAFHYRIESEKTELGYDRVRQIAERSDGIKLKLASQDPEGTTIRFDYTSPDANAMLYCYRKITGETAENLNVEYIIWRSTLRSSDGANLLESKQDDIWKNVVEALGWWPDKWYPEPPRLHRNSVTFF